MLAIMIHEISHFYFFQKFSEIYPEIGKDKYDSPHIEWLMSEIMVENILNDERMQKVFKYDFKTYDEFQKKK